MICGICSSWADEGPKAFWSRDHHRFCPLCPNPPEPVGQAAVKASPAAAPDDCSACTPGDVCPSCGAILGYTSPQVAAIKLAHLWSEKK